MLHGAMARTEHEGWQGYPCHATILTRNRQWSQAVIDMLDQQMHLNPLFHRTGAARVELDGRNSREGQSSIMAMSWDDEPALQGRAASMGVHGLYADPDWALAYHPVMRDGRRLGRIPRDPAATPPARFMRFAMPAGDQMSWGRELPIDAPIPFEEVCLEIGTMHHPVMPSTNVWQHMSGDVGLLEGFVPTSCTASRWLDIIEQAMLHDRRPGIPADLLQAVVSRPLHEAEELITRADMRSLTVPAGTLTMETLLEAQREMNELARRSSSEARRATMDRMMGMDYSQAELRALASMGIDPSDPYASNPYAHQADCGIPECPDRRVQHSRESSQLRPIEDWQHETDQIVTEARQRWLRKKSLPDTREGPAPVPGQSHTHASDAARYHEDDHGEDAEVLSGPVSFLPALKK